jgi:hypothetical protein
VLDAFRQATKAALSLLGEGSLLRGTVSCKVNIEHGVQLTGYDDNVVVTRSVATIDSEVDPKVGDTLTHPDGNFKLDTLLEDKGAFRRFMLLRLP